MNAYMITPNIGCTNGTPIFTLAASGPAALAAVMATGPKLPGNWKATSGAVALVTSIPLNAKIV